MKANICKTITMSVCLLFMNTICIAQEKSLPSTVMKLSGDARYSGDNGKTWRPVKLGQRLKSGVLIQTAEFGSVDILLGEDIHPLPKASEVNGALFDPEQYSENLVGLFNNSAMDIVSVTRAVDGRTKAPMEHTELDLRGGAIIVNVKKLPTNSLFAVRCSTNAVLKMQDAVAQISSTGNFGVFKGSVNVRIPEKEFVTNVISSYQFDIATTTTTNFDLPHNWRHDIWLLSDPIYEDWAKPPKR